MVDNDKTIEEQEKKIIKKFDGSGPCNYSETGAKLEFSHNLRNSVEKLNKSTSIQNWIMIILTVILIILTVVLLLK